MTNELAIKVADFTQAGGVVSVDINTTADLVNTIRQLWTEREQLRATLQEVRTALEYCRPEHVTAPLLSAIDKVLNDKE